MRIIPFSQLDLSNVNVIDQTFSKSDFTLIDLSVDNLDLMGIDITSADTMEAFISNHVKSNTCKVAFGGYLEVRDLYKRSDYFSQETDVINERNIHLGVDIWVAAGTSVLAALEGVVHSFQNNTNHGDYGPTIILEHQIDGITFYSLYGHLSAESIVDKVIGMKVKQGEVIATLGDKSVNGDYAPHLHFQIVIDLQGKFGDYPGVCSQKDLSYYKENCPDANILLGLN
jgi:murein DD-endopeptidase MepM/ murein hydrolase activator NlpD